MNKQWQQKASINQGLQKPNVSSKMWLFLIIFAWISFHLEHLKFCFQIKFILKINFNVKGQMSPCWNCKDSININLGEHLPRTKTVFLREILFPAVELVFSSRYNYMIWFKIKIYTWIFKNWVSKCNGLWDTHHLKEEVVPFFWRFETSYSADSKTLHWTLPFEMALDHILYDIFNNRLA